MSWRRRFAKIGALFHRRKPLDDLEEEIRSHLAMEEHENLEAGMPPDEAHYAALRRFGNVTQTKERSWEMWGWQWLETLLQDLRYGLRQLRRNPGFTVVAILTLALGIGANTAIFTLVDSVMLNALPVANPGELYRLGNRNDSGVSYTFEDQGWDLFSYPLYVDLRDNTQQFSDLAAFQSFSTQLVVRRMDSGARARPYQGEFVSGNYFRMFGVGAFAGRVFTSQDDRPAASPVAVLSYRTWQQDFGSNSSIIGATFAVNSVPFTVVGITPPRFFGDTLKADPPALWLPLSTEPVLDGKATILNHPGENWLYAIGRLKPGAQPQQVQSELTVELRRWLSTQSGFAARHKKEIPRQSINLAPAGGGVQRLQNSYSSGLRLLMILVGIVLLIACSNIANFLLARGAASRLNTAVRTALGAPRRRLIRQTLIESIALAVIGGTAGLYLAYVGAHAIIALAFRGSHYVPLNVKPSFPVFGFALALSLVTGIIFGLVPAWMNSRSDPAEVLRGARRSAGDHASLARRAFVVLQVALCTVLLASSGLLTESLRNLQDQPYGFQTKGRWVVKVNPLIAGVKPDQLHALYQQLEPELSRIPGVLSASYSLYSPMEGNNWTSGIHIEGQSKEYGASWLRIGPRYFETIGTPIVRGRTVSEQDTPTSRRVAMVNQAFVRKFFPHQDPLGQHFGIGGLDHGSDFEIVGVVGDAKYTNARKSAAPSFFIPFLQSGNYNEQAFNAAMLRSNYMGSIELRVAGEPENLEANVRRVLAKINPNLTILDMMSLGDQLGLNFNQDRLIARLTELFGLLALVLACVGLYGVTSYSVARRTNEIGIRMALGAGRGNILKMILRGGLAQTIFGLVIGVPIALAATRLFASILYSVKPTDPITFITVSLVLIAVGLLACYIPARRAAKVDPIVALRYE